MIFLSSCRVADARHPAVDAGAHCHLEVNWVVELALLQLLELPFKVSYLFLRELISA
jgi:hypothetical protein